MSGIIVTFKKNSLHSIFIAMFVIVGIGLIFSHAVERFLAWQVNSAILHHAEQSVYTWSEKFFSMTPRATQMIQSGQGLTREKDAINSLSRLSDVNRLRLYNDRGYLTYKTSGTTMTMRESDYQNLKALKTFQTGQPNSQLTRQIDYSAPNPNPHHTVITFIPAISPHGTKVGVIEAHVDVSSLKKDLEFAFERVGQYLIVSTMCVLMIPSLAFMFRSWQVIRKNRELLELTRYDQLTGLLNRASATRILDSYFSQNVRSVQLGILFIDVDHFKQINDHYGHEGGDQILKRVAQSLKDSIRADTDVAARYGGDEFLLICPNADMSTLKRIHTRIKNHLNQVSSTRIPLPSLSVGAYVTCDGDSERDTLHRADAAVYAAKRQGRGQFIEYAPDLDDIFEDNFESTPAAPNISVAAH
ncbi:MAG: GGDEF domain-containing protein [Rhodobacteraceae bacterium]|nr:GGDEF domain-containing protein [Paracoccaceae bacterium]